MKYKVGDKVRVRSDLVLYDRTYGGLSFTTTMSEFKGKTVTIKLVLGNKYRLVEDTGEFAWSDEMLEDVEEEFKLPEKWYIRLTKENKSSLEQWRTCGSIVENEGFVVSKVHSHKGYFYHIDSLPSEFKTEITFDQFKKYVLKESEATPVKEEVKFEVGKWYKYSAEYINHKTYAKYSGNQSVRGRFYYDEIITENNGFKKGHNWSILTCEPVLLTDLSEIQQYLPENHPDKIKRKTKKAEDLKYPDVVHCSSKEQHDKINSFAGLVGYDGDKWYLTGSHGRASKPYDEAGGKGYTNYEFSDIIFPEEKVETEPILSKEELLAEAKRRYPVGTRFNSTGGHSGCIVTNESVFTLESDGDIRVVNTGGDFMFGRVYSGHNDKWAEIVEDKQKEEIPEYVECIKNSSGFTAGKTYKTNLESTGLHYKIDIDDNGIRNGWASCNFKPSTKEAFDEQGKSVVEKKEELVQTGLSQSQACDSCKYHGEECAKRRSCDAIGGQHYPKDNLSKKYVVGIDPSDAESSSEGIEVGKFPLDRGIGIYKEMARLHMQAYYPMGPINDIYKTPAEPKDCFGSDEIYVPIIKTEVKQIKL